MVSNKIPDWALLDYVLSCWLNRSREEMEQNYIDAKRNDSNRISHLPEPEGRRE